MKTEMLKNKLSLLNATKYIEKLKGIEVVSLSLDMPEEIHWYSGELNNLNFDNKPLYRLPSDISIAELSNLLLEVIDLKEEFILVISVENPAYLSFKINDLTGFLASYTQENSSKDVTLFYKKEKKLIDIFLGEHDLEISIFNK